MITTKEALDFRKNSPHQCLRKYIENNMEKMHTDITV